MCVSLDSVASGRVVHGCILGCAQAWIRARARALLLSEARGEQEPAQGARASSAGDPDGKTIARALVADRALPCILRALACVPFFVRGSRSARSLKEAVSYRVASQRALVASGARGLFLCFSGAGGRQLHGVGGGRKQHKLRPHIGQQSSPRVRFEFGIVWLVVVRVLPNICKLGCLGGGDPTRLRWRQQRLRRRLSRQRTAG